MGGIQKIAFLIGILFLTFSSQAQKEVPFSDNASLNYEDLQLQELSAANGLLQNSIKDIIKDEQNLMWILSERGLSSYDGKNFIHFSGPDFLVKALVENKHGQILSDKFYIENGRVIKANINDSIIINHYGVLRNLEDVPIIDSGKGPSAFYSENGGYYYALKENLYHVKDDLALKIVDSAEYRKTSFYRDKKLFMITRKGEVQVFNDDKLVARYQHPSLKGVDRLLWCHNSSRHYYQSGPNLYGLKINEQGKPSIELILKNIPTLPLRSLMVDESQQTIYLGTVGNGIHILKPKYFNSLYDPQLSKWNNSYSQIEIGYDSVLTATGLLFTPYTIEKAGLYNRLKGTILLRDKKDQIWTTLTRKEDQEQEGFQNGLSTDLNLVSNRVHGNLRPGTRGELIIKENEDGLIKTTAGDTVLYKSIFKNKSLQLYDSLSNTFWFTKERDLFIYHVKGDTMIAVPHPEDWRFHGFYVLKSNMVIAFVKEKGLKAFYQNKWIDLPLDSDAKIAYPHCFLEDQKGFFWLSTNNGIFKLLRKELIAYITGEAHQIYYHWFGQDAVIQNIELNGGCIPCGLKLSSGKFSFPSLKGLVWFDPRKVILAPHHKDILIRKVLIDEIDTTVTLNSEFSQDMDRLEFLISAPYYGHPYNNNYIQYQLEGLSEQWYPVPEDHLISFSKLKYGSYKLNIRRKLGFGINNYASIEFPFQVSKFYYQETWFKVLSVLLISLLVALVFWLRTKVSKSIQNRMKNEIESQTQSYRILNEELKLNNAQLTSSENDLKKALKVQERLIELYAHQIRGPLKFMGDAAGQNAQKVEKMETKELKKWFQTISSTSDKMYEQTERLFNLMISSEKGLKVELLEIPIKESIENLLAKFKELIKKNQLDVSVNIDEESHCFGDINMFEIIINNLIENSIKNTQNGFIRIEAYAINNYIVVLIEDNGKGMNPDLVNQLNDGSFQSNSENGFGLSTVMILLNEMGGYLQVESEISVGTSVSVFLKKNL